MSPEEEMSAKHHAEWVKEEVTKKRRQEYLTRVSEMTDDEIVDLLMAKDAKIKTLDEQLASEDQEKERLEAEAKTDKLTGLPNRRGLEDRMSRLLREAIGRQQEHHRESDTTIREDVFGIVDVDGFKAVNDTLGHEAGDVVLKAIAKTLQTGFRPEDFVARLGGDEFAVILTNVNEEQAAKVFQRVSDSMPDKIKDVLGNHQGYVGVSIGAKKINADMTAPEIIREADAEMYQRKRAKKLAMGLPISEARRD